ncbi:MAG: DUF1015 domain-containing protein [Candidatus Fimenecus sp.]
MAVLKAFRAYRPAVGFADKVAALPYDVMNSDEARKTAFGNPYSFLHVDKAEIDLPKTVDIYDEKVYLKAKENLGKLISADVLQQDEIPCLYIYMQTWQGRTQTGLVGCTAVDDYQNAVIKKHEFTRADKEQDRIRHVDTLDANTGPIFLTYRGEAEITAVLENWKDTHAPIYDFTANEVRQTVWVVDDCAVIENLVSQFGKVPSLYIADGHHRAASAVKVAEKRRAEHPNYDGTEEFNFFLSVLFPAEELRILDYNRLMLDLNGFTAEALLTRLRQADFTVEKAAQSPFKPTEKHTFGLYLQGAWYALKVNPESVEERDPVRRLDVSILQERVIAPIFGIDDPRTDKRIDFVGGIRGLAELEHRVDSGEAKAAFAMFPTSPAELMAIADAGLVMPPKSTWFEPKLLSGLFIHFLSQ